MKGLRYVGLGAAAAVASFLVAPLLLRQAKPPAPLGPLDLPEGAIDPAVWGRKFPFQFDAYKRPAAEEPRWREKRGHAYSLKDRDESERDEDPRWIRVFAGRPKERPLPGGCLECHAAGGFRGLEPYFVARLRVDRPVACIDCHDPKTLRLRVTRPAFSDATKATPQQMRAFVCAQCHVEYYLDPGTKLVLYPRSKGLKVEQIEAHYDEINFSDWRHAETGAPILKAQHPQFEMWNQGIHARSGVACADCHMPYLRQGALRLSDHQARSPLDNIERACLPCHSFPPEEMKARVRIIQDRTAALLSRALDALLALLDEIKAARASGVAEQRLEAALHFQRRAQWRVDFVHADHSKGFHAPQEAARILSEAIDYARQGQLAAARNRGQTERSPGFPR